MVQQRYVPGGWLWNKKFVKRREPGVLTDLLGEEAMCRRYYAEYLDVKKIKEGSKCDKRVRRKNRDLQLKYRALFHPDAPMLKYVESEFALSELKKVQADQEEKDGSPGPESAEISWEKLSRRQRVCFMIFHFASQKLRQKRIQLGLLHATPDQLDPSLVEQLIRKKRKRSEKEDGDL